MARRPTDLNNELLSLIDAVYCCATDPDRWPAFLDRLTGATNSRGTTLMLHDLTSNRGASLWQHGFDPAVIEIYPQWADRNVYFLEGGHHLRTGTVVRGEDAVDDRRVMRTDFFNEYLRRADTLHHTAACVFREQSIVALLLIQKAVHDSSHSESERRLVELLLPHVQRAVAIQRRLAGTELARAAAGEALDRLATGICLLDRRGRAILINRVARSIFDQKDGLSLDGTGVPSGAPVSAFRSMIERSVTRSTPVLLAGDALLVQRPSGRRPFTVMVCPLRLSAFTLSVDPPAAILLIADPEMNLETADEIVARVYGLTPTESRITRLLLEGESAEGIATLLQVTGNTVRTHLKRIYSKTDTRGQSDLIRLLLGWAGHCAALNAR